MSKSPHARERSLEKKLWNRLDWGLRELDVSAPNYLEGKDLLDWARAKLQTLTEESVEDGDRIAAARALVSSAHAELEHIERQRQFNLNRADGPKVGGRPWQELTPSERQAAILEAETQIATLKAQTQSGAPIGLPAPVEAKDKDAK